MSIVNDDGDKKTVGLIIPTLNEVQNIKYVFPFIPDYIDEIIVVDGGSLDGTVEEILRFRKDINIIVEKSSGKGTAIRYGFKKAVSDLIVMMDADGSNDPREIPKLLQPVLNGYDVSMGSRLLKGGGSEDITLFRKFGNYVLVKLVNFLYRSNYSDLCYGFRVFKREAIEKIHPISKGFEIETEQSILIKKAGLKVKEVPSYETKRRNGDSNLNSFRDGWKIFNVIIRNKFIPTA